MCMKKKMTTHLVVISAKSYTYLQQKKQNTPQRSIIQNSRNLCKLCQKNQNKFTTHITVVSSKSHVFCVVRTGSKKIWFSVNYARKKWGKKNWKHTSGWPHQKQTLLDPRECNFQ